MGVTTVRIPDDLHNEAKILGINVSLACLHGIRIHLGLKCAQKQKCKCYMKAELLQDLLLKMEQKFLDMEDKFKRQKDHAWTFQEKPK